MKHPHRDFVIYYSDLWLEEWKEQTRKLTKPTRTQIDNIIKKTKNK